MISTFFARALAWWLKLFFAKRVAAGEVSTLSEPDAAYAVSEVQRGQYRAVPPGVDREAFRKVQRSIRKMQRKIAEGKMTEAEALAKLGLEVER